MSKKSQILGAPSIVPGDPEITANIERTATLQCRAFGSPKPRVTWLKNGVKLLDEQMRSGSGKYARLPDDSLLIQSLILSDFFPN